MSAKLRVLVIDDSAFARKVVREVLSNHPGIEVVGIARDGLDALEKIAELTPDVITLDLVMPNLDGIGVLRALPPPPTRPAVVVVSIADDDSELGVAALTAGAFDVVKKPTALALDGLYTLEAELCEKVLAAGAARRSGALDLRAVSEPVRAAIARRTEIVVIGASTGGPQALSLLLRSLPGDFPVPIAVVLHMPVGYTEAFARRLDADCAIDVIEARDDLPLRRGQAVVARAGSHLFLAPSAGETSWQAMLSATPADSLHRPSVDCLFESAAKSIGKKTLGVVLTGMGSDGTAGARAIRDAGGRVLTEAEVSCVVYGMPRSVVEAGLSDESVALEGMASSIVRNL